MAGNKLTKSFIEGLPRREKDYFEWCGQLPGFGCRVRPSGTKSLVAQYRIGGRNSPTRRVTIGKFPKITVEQARAKAREILAKAELGEDVAGDRAKRRSALNMAQLCDEYLAEACSEKNASTLAIERGRIERHIKPLLGNRLITEIESVDIKRFLQDVGKGKTATDQKIGAFGRAIVRGGKGTATRTVRLLGSIFKYAVECGYLRVNPRHGVELYRDGKNERFLDAAEMQRLGDALRQAESDGLPWKLNEAAQTKHLPKIESRREVISPFAIGAIRLLLLTGCRAGEILSLKWDQVDFERGFLNLSASKTGKRSIVLGAPALKVLADLPRIQGNPYVIVGKAEGKARSDLKRPWKRITEHAGLQNLRLHDLRHSYASVGAASGMGLPIVGKLLGHSSPATTARYAHLADDPLRRASDSISHTIAAAMDSGKAVQNVEVRLENSRNG